MGTSLLNMARLAKTPIKVAQKGSTSRKTQGLYLNVCKTEQTMLTKQSLMSRVFIRVLSFALITFLAYKLIEIVSKSIGRVNTRSPVKSLKFTASEFSIMNTEDVKFRLIFVQKIVALFKSRLELYYIIALKLKCHKKLRLSKYNEFM